MPMIDDDFLSTYEDACRQADRAARKTERPAAETNGDGRDEPPPVESIEDYGHEPPPRPLNLDAIPLTLEEWLNRDLPPPDRLMGEWLTTTSRVLMNAPTGIGKTNFGLTIAAHGAAGCDFLHWHAHRAARVLFIDGEMSRRLLKRRAQDVTRRLGFSPSNLFLLSHEDVENFQPLNTPAGRAFVEAIVEKIGGVDLIVFDNVMCLVAGDMKEEEGWRAVLPLINSLTKRAIGQIWIHHTGHDESRGYGTKTREWRMDTVLHLTDQPRADTDISFLLEFRKARERTPETRQDFEDVTIALVDDEWTSTAGTKKQGKPSPLAAKFLEALQDAFATGETVMFQSWKAVKLELWQQECTRRGLLDQSKPTSARSLFSKYKRELIAHNLIACNNDLVWLVR
jgi:AAA domain